jgi:hypothetical protein
MVGIGMRRIGRYGTATGAVLLTLALSVGVAHAEPPIVTIATPSPGTVTNESPTTFAGSTDDPLDAVSVVLSREGSPPQEEMTFPVGNSWTVQANLGDGTYSAVARQTDSGTLEEGASAEVTFTLDTVKPDLTLNSVGSPTDDPTPTFGGNAGEGTGEASPDGPVRVEVLSGPTPVVAEDVGVSSGAWSYTVPSELPDGEYTVQVTQQDQAGNKTEKSATFVVDTAAPQVSLAALESVIADATPGFHGGAGTATGDASTVKLVIYAGTAASGTVVQHLETSRSGASWSATSSKSMADGTYTAIAEQADSAGNLGKSEPSTFTIKTKGPAISLDPLGSYTNRSLPVFSGELGTAQHDLAEVTLEIFSGTAALGKPIGTAEATVDGTRWTAVATSPLVDGQYTAVARQRDEANNVGVSIARTFTVDTQAPQPTLSAPAESAGLEPVSGSAGTAQGDRLQVTAELFAGATTEGAPVETITVNQSTGAWTATFAGLAPGQYTVIARQSDEAGNTGFSPPQSFIVSAPPAAPAPARPTPPAASFTWLPSTPTVGQSVSFVSKSTDVSSPITGFGWDMAGNGPFVAGGPLTTASFATAGTHTVRLQVSDALGQSSTVAEAVAVAPRPLTLMQPFPIVRIAGAETHGGARIKLLSVQAPPAAKIAVSCHGRGCKTKAETRVVTASTKRRPGAITLAFPRFQRALGAGAVLQIRVTRSGEIGKYTSFTIRRGKLPLRVDACLRPTSTRSIPCPSQ